MQKAGDICKVKHKYLVHLQTYKKLKKVFREIQKSFYELSEVPPQGHAAKRLK